MLTKILSYSAIVKDNSIYRSGIDSNIEVAPIIEIQPIQKRTYLQDIRDSLQKIQQELKGGIRRLIPQNPRKLRTPLLLCDPPILDIAAISTIGFHFNIYQKDNKVFITSLYKINQIINEKEEGLAKESNKELVKRLLPTYLLSYKDAFLKVALDILPPY